MNEEEIFKAVESARSAIAHLITSTYSAESLSGVPAVEAKLIDALIVVELLELVKATVPGAGLPLDPLPKEVEELRSELRKAREENKIVNSLLDSRNGVLSLIPECRQHGVGCLTHAEEWIKKMVGLSGIEFGVSDDLSKDIKVNAVGGTGVSIEHLPTGVVVTSRHRQSMFANKALAMKAILGLTQQEGGDK